MIVITNPISVENEISIIHSLFAEGLRLLHVRKPHFSEIEMATFVSKIGSECRSQLVLHTHHHLASEFGMDKLHFSEKNRLQLGTTSDEFQKSVRYKSTSVHTIKYFNMLENSFDSAFLSPVYPSISKPNYVPQQNHLETIKQRTNFSTKLIALGGISPENIQQTLENGFDEIALLGTIWNNNNRLENFTKCQKIVLSCSL